MFNFKLILFSPHRRYGNACTDEQGKGASGCVALQIKPPGTNVADQIKLVLSYAVRRDSDLTWITPLVISNLPNEGPRFGYQPVNVLVQPLAKKPNAPFMADSRTVGT